MEKKKILFVVTKGNFGGAQRYVFDLATSLKDEFNVSVAFGQAGTLSEKLSNAGIETINLENLKRDGDFSSDIKSLFEFFSVFKKYKPNIVHLNSSKAGFIGAMSARVYNLFFGKKYGNIKIIFTAHGWASDEDRPIFEKTAYYILHIFTVLFSNKTIAVSKKTKENMAIFDFVSKKISVIHNGITEIPLLSKANARTFLDKNSKFKVWIGTISELHKNKGLDIAIKGIAPLLKENPNIGFYIIGNGEEKDALVKIAKSLNIASQVIFMGFVENARQYLKAFDIFTLSSRKEGFPYTLIEAGFARVPVIATDVGGIPEIIKNLETGLLIKPKISSEFYHAVRYALEHKKDTTLLGTNLYNFSTKEFSLSKMKEKTEDIYTN